MFTTTTTTTQSNSNCSSRINKSYLSNSSAEPPKISSWTAIKNNRLQVISGHLKASNNNTNNIQNQSNGSSSNGKNSNMTNNPLTSHVLDTTLGLPAVNVQTTLYKQQGGNTGEWVKILERKTNNDGRLMNLMTDAEFTPGIYKFYFDTKSYYDGLNMKTFYPFVEIVFEIQNPTQHYHVPLLLSPFGYSTYRGS